jgi:hypothetical protein
MEFLVIVPEYIDILEVAGGEGGWLQSGSEFSDVVKAVSILFHHLNN